MFWQNKLQHYCQNVLYSRYAKQIDTFNTNWQTYTKHLNTKQSSYETLYTASYKTNEHVYRTNDLMKLFNSLCVSQFYRAAAMHARYSHERNVCLSVRLSNAWIVTKRKHLAKKVKLWLIVSRLLAYQWA